VPTVAMPKAALAAILAPVDQPLFSDAEATVEATGLEIISGFELEIIWLDNSGLATLPVFLGSLEKLVVELEFLATGATVEATELEIIWLDDSGLATFPVCLSSLEMLVFELVELL
jgi:hypothetical protein